ncbi:MAG: amidohydrolase family protein [Deltaproteobacteria bacterium]|nr:amidohydrolase family protein [Deltaproteobacteria bacterium]
MRIEAGKVEELTSQDARTPADALTLDCGGGLIGPADVNAHTHLYSGLAPLGMPAPEPAPENFVQILERVWWRLDRALDADSLRASARFYVAEALLAGTGALVDHHESPNLIEGSLDILADACQELGMRALLCYGATERNGGIDEARRGLAECGRFIKENQRPLVRGVVALHASFTVSDETIAEAAALCHELDTVLHIHLAEDSADVEDAKNRGYQGPLDRLEKLGALRPGTILAHGVHLSAEQVARASEHGCWIVQNPRSNRGNRVGYSRFLGYSDRVALGTDGYPSRMNDELVTLIEEATQRREKLCDVCRRPERGRELMAERFGVPLGANPGERADVAVLTCEPQAVRVRHLVINGDLAVRDGALVNANVDDIRDEAREQAAKLWERMRAL